MLCEDTRRTKICAFAGMTGFLLGICSANLWMKQYVLDIGILNQYFLEQYNGQTSYMKRICGIW